MTVSIHSEEGNLIHHQIAPKEDYKPRKSTAHNSTWGATQSFVDGAKINS